MRVCCLVALVAIVVGVGTVYAGPKQDIQAKVKEAYENYDLMDYDGAKKSLNQALAIAKKSKLDKDASVAKAHLAMGIVALVEKDTDAAKLAFLSAVQADPKIQIDPGYKSPEATKLLEAARTEASGGGDAEMPTVDQSQQDGPDCTAIVGLEHKIIDEGKTNTSVPIDAYLALDVEGVTKVSVMYRPEGSTEFTEAKLKKDGQCKYTGKIPSSAMKGGLLHYYVAAFNEFNKPVASKGSSGSPNLIELSAGPSVAAGGGDDENPMGEVVGGPVDTGPVVERKKPKLMIAVTGGTGFGYVSGETEGMNTVKNCCLGSSLVVIIPEIGFFVSPKLSIGVAGRIGIPVGANVDGHATAAPGGVLRVRYALGANGDGLRLMGQAGVGVMRNTIKLDNSEPGMDTDIVAQGPLLLGGGIGFSKRLSSNLSFIADLSALAGIPLGTALSGLSPKFNTGFGADLSIGLQVGI